MQKYRVTGPDGKSVIIEAESPEAAKAIAQRSVPNTNPGVSPEAPPEMFLNPQTGQYTSRELLTNAMQPSRGQAAQIGGMQGLSFGGADEIMGGAAALTDGSEGYTFGREYTRSAEEAARRDFPITTTGAEVAGGVGTALTYGMPAIANRGVGGAVIGGMGVGAAEGTGYGFLSGEGSVRDRLLNAIKFGTFGGAAGGIAPLASYAGRAVGRGVGDLIGGGIDLVAQKGRQGRADRAIAATLAQSGKTPDEIGRELMRAAQEGQDVYRAADAMGVAGQRRLSGITRSGGDAAQEVSDFLRQRQLDQSDRVAGFVEDGFDASRTANATRTALEEARDEAATVNYGAARANAGAVNLTPAIETIDELLNVNPILGETALARSEIGTRLAALRSRMQAGGEQLIDFNEVLRIKTELGGQIANLRSSGKKVPPELAQVLRALDSALEDASDGYRTANDSFRDASRVIDAVDEGASMSRPGARYADTTARFSQMTPDQQAAARVGYGDRALARIEGATEGTNAARPYTKTKLREEARTMATDPDKFLRRMDRENTMFETNFRALGGSRTADNLEDIADLRGLDGGLLTNVLTGRFGEAARQAIAQSGNVLTGATPKTREIIAQAMLAKDATALRRALAKAETSEQRRQVTDTILRMISQRAVAPALIE